MTGPRIALIADVHGNRWALEAVLADIERHRCDLVINAGDCVYGPLDPSGTAELLMNLTPHAVRGNQDRILLDRTGTYGDTHSFVVDSLTETQLTWFGLLPSSKVVDRILVVHGTPQSDTHYLLERVTTDGLVVPATAAEAVEQTGSVDADLLVCGHSHLPRMMQLPSGLLCINPGSVGLPAYRSDDPVDHRMESGSPHARYAVATRRNGGWDVSFQALDYPWTEAAETARTLGRPDWRTWLTTGRTDEDG
ncbi:MAG: metallophosphoesterase family protein [Gemmatimonadales bacterium]